MDEREVTQRNCVRFRHELSEERGEDVTQQRLAELAGLSLDTIRGYEQGRRSPDRDAGRKLAEVFGRAFEDFFNPDPPPPRPRPKIAWRLKIEGDPPPGLREYLERAAREYTPERAEGQSRRKREMLKGTKAEPKPRKK